MEQGNKALKSGVWYTLSNFIVKALALITTPIFSRLLTHAEFGLYNDFTACLNTLSIFVTLNLEASLVNSRYDYKDSYDEYVFSVLSLSSLSAVTWFVLINAFSGSVTRITGINLSDINWMLVYLFTLPAISMFQVNQRFEYRYKLSVFISLLLATATTVGSLVLVYYCTDKLKGRIIGSVFPTVIIGIILYIYIWIRGKKIKVRYWQYAMSICLPYIPHLLSMTVLNSIDKIMITRICGAEDNALYSLAYTCGSVITLLIVSMNTAFIPWLADRIHDNEISDIRGNSKKYIGAFVFFSIGFILVTPEILLFMGGKSYIEAIYVMPPVAFSCVCQFLYTMYVNIEQIKKKTSYMAFASVSAALINYVLNTIFIPKFGYIAAAYTTLIGYLCLLIMHMIIVKTIGYFSTYSSTYVIAAVIVMLVFTIFVNIIYAHMILRYFFIGIYAIGFVFCLYKCRTTLLQYFRRG